MMKKRYLFLIVFLLLTFISFSQNPSRLDEKMGFNKFKIEESFSNYKKDCKFLYKDEKKNIEFYEYIKNDINIVFEQEIKKISLKSHKERLFEISIEFKLAEDSRNQFEFLTMNLIRLYGTEKPSFLNGTAGYIAYYWRSEKVSLFISGFQDPDNEKKMTTIRISLSSIKIDSEIANSGF